tara:strand:- start:1552 stop:1932 length:381 start_codon:yes stop_codon:yes gene_type:complete
MAKPKPTHVIRHEFVLGKVEREMAEHVALTKSINNILTPIATVVAGSGMLLAGYASYQWLKGGVFADIFNPEWRDANLPMWSEQQKAKFREANPTLWSRVWEGPAVFWQSVTNWYGTDSNGPTSPK